MAYFFKNLISIFKKDLKSLNILLVFFVSNILISQNYYLYVASESDDTVSLLKFDGIKIKEEERINVGFYPTEIEGPHGITVDPNGKFWYVTLAHGNPYGSLIKYSTENNKIIDKTTLGIFPASMQISSVTGFIYCVNFNLHGKMEPSSVSVVDAETMTEITQITTGSMPHGSRISKDGLKQYSVAMMSGELFEIDVISLNISRKLDLEDHSKMDHSKMNMDGNKKGYDVKLLNEVSSKVSVPVIASGGAGRIEDLHDAIVLGLSDAVYL